ncbi:hypothetical protein [Gemmatimonas sp.]|uniref:hypothetical protein n=1 Tax=Gemmatimonas sp. TaxID=1962908 RepID=UPI0026250AFE|nr:hypothetical protein [Gemmatimonas sp.]
MPPATAAVPMRMGRALLGFTAAQGAIIVVAMLVMQRFIWTDAAAAGAVRASAWVAFSVQSFTFVIARLVAREQVIAGWGLGVLMRFASLLLWAFLGIKALGLVSGPALISLVVFYFVSTLVEPLFLN